MLGGLTMNIKNTRLLSQLSKNLSSIARRLGSCMSWYILVWGNIWLKLMIKKSDHDSSQKSHSGDGCTWAALLNQQSLGMDCETLPASRPPSQTCATHHKSSIAHAGLAQTCSHTICTCASWGPTDTIKSKNNSIFFIVYVMFFVCLFVLFLVCSCFGFVCCL